MPVPFVPVLIGAAIGWVANELLSDEDEKPKPEVVHPPILTWREQVANDIKYLPFLEVFGSEVAYKEINDAHFHQLRKNFLSKYRNLEHYINNDLDQSYMEHSLSSYIDNEGFDYAIDGYHDWKSDPEIKDEKFHRLRNEYLSAKMKLLNYLGYIND